MFNNSIDRTASQVKKSTQENGDLLCGSDIDVVLVDDVRDFAEPLDGWDDIDDVWDPAWDALWDPYEDDLWEDDWDADEEIGILNLHEGPEPVGVQYDPISEELEPVGTQRGVTLCVSCCFECQVRI